MTRLFHRQGQIILAREAAAEDALMEIAARGRAEDCKAEPQGFEISTTPARFEAVHKQIEAGGPQGRPAEVTELATVTVPLREDQAAAVNRLIDALEDHDDVKEVYSNAEFPEDAAKAEG